MSRDKNSFILREAFLLFVMLGDSEPVSELHRMESFHNKNMRVFSQKKNWASDLVERYIKQIGIHL